MRLGWKGTQLSKGLSGRGKDSIKAQTTFIAEFLCKAPKKTVKVKANVILLILL